MLILIVPSDFYTLQMFHSWMGENGLLEPNCSSCFVTCGDWDLKTMYILQYLFLLLVQRFETLASCISCISFIISFIYFFIHFISQEDSFTCLCNCNHEWIIIPRFLVQVLLTYPSWYSLKSNYMPAKQSSKLLNNVHIPGSLFIRLPGQCQYFGIKRPSYFNHWINIKKVLSNKMEKIIHCGKW